MQTERQREAAEFRAQGSQRSQEIRARADRDVTVLVAEASSHGEQTRGEGDAERNRIFAEAYGKDPDFFSFYRSMQAYENGLRPNDTRMVLRPDFDFFKYFGDPSGKGARHSGGKRSGSEYSGAATAPHPAATVRTRQLRRPLKRRRSRGSTLGTTPIDDFLAALGLVFVIEGLLFAAFPEAARRAVEMVGKTPDQTLRTIGIVSAVLGLAVVWPVRG